MRIVEVNIEDVYPFEDEYGNQFLSRDYSTKENQRYVHELAKSMAKKGIPDEPVQLVAEGGIYRIKSGNSRVMAMRELGTKKFPAIVYDEDDLVESIETVIRTNVKKKYEAVEESRFVQQLTMFASDEYVAETAGMDVERVRRIRKGRDKVDDAAEDMTLWRLEAIGEFADDPEAVAALTNCTEKEYQAIAAKYRAERERSTKEGEIIAALNERGIEFGDVSGMKLVKTFSDVSRIPDELPEGCVAACHSIPGFFLIYSPAKGEEVSDDKEQMKAMRSALSESYAVGAQRRSEWLAENIGDSNATKALAKSAQALDGRFDDPTVRNFVRDAKIKPEKIAVGGGEIIALFIALNKTDYGICGYECKPLPGLCKNYVSLLDAMEAGGYEPDEEEQTLYQQAIDCLEGWAKK